jgi:ParB-like chromosome segregation protein Spo0J
MKTSFNKMSIEELVQSFADNCVRQDEAGFKDQISEYKKLYKQMAAIVDELKSRAPDARSALVSLYDHPNVQVKLQAAKLSLAVAPSEARQVIEAIARSGWMPQAGDAGMCLWFLDAGVFVPK